MDFAGACSAGVAGLALALRRSKTPHTALAAGGTSTRTGCSTVLAALPLHYCTHLRPEYSPGSFTGTHQEIASGLASIQPRSSSAAANFAIGADMGGSWARAVGVSASARAAAVRDKGWPVLLLGVSVAPSSSENLLRLHIRHGPAPSMSGNMYWYGHAGGLSVASETGANRRPRPSLTIRPRPRPRPRPSVSSHLSYRLLASQDPDDHHAPTPAPAPHSTAFDSPPGTRPRPQTDEPSFLPAPQPFSRRGRPLPAQSPRHGTAQPPMAWPPSRLHNPASSIKPRHQQRAPSLRQRNRPRNRAFNIHGRSLPPYSKWTPDLPTREPPRPT